MASSLSFNLNFLLQQPDDSRTASETMSHLDKELELTWGGAKTAVKKQNTRTGVKLKFPSFTSEVEELGKAWVARSTEQHHGDGQCDPNVCIVEHAYVKPDERRKYIRRLGRRRFGREFHRDAHMHPLFSLFGERRDSISLQTDDSLT